MSKALVAFKGDPALKKFVVGQLRQHKKLDRIVQGQYWANGRGCAVGCTLEAVRVHLGDNDIAHSSHALYERHLGIPAALAALEDQIFERLAVEGARQWPLSFTGAIQPGADLSMVIPLFLFWLLSERLPKHVDKKQSPEVWRAISGVATLYKKWCAGKKPSKAQFEKAANAADAARYAARYAASAASAASAAADAAADAAARNAAYAEYKKMAAKLISLLRECD